MLVNDDGLRMIVMPRVLALVYAFVNEETRYSP